MNLKQSSSDPHVSATHNTGLQAHVGTPDFFHGCWGFKLRSSCSHSKQSQLLIHLPIRHHLFFLFLLLRQSSTVYYPCRSQTPWNLPQLPISLDYRCASSCLIFDMLGKCSLPLNLYPRPIFLPFLPFSMLTRNDKIQRIYYTAN